MNDSQHDTIDTLYHQITNLSTKSMEIDDRQIPNQQELNQFIKQLCGIRHEFFSRSYKWDSPFQTILDAKKDYWCDNEYHIVFLGTGILIRMNEFILKRIGILNSILLKQNGSDTAIRLKYYDDKIGQTFQGPHLYITSLPPESLLFDSPTQESQVEITRGVDNKHLQDIGFFKHKNVGEALYNYLWYQ